MVESNNDWIQNVDLGWSWSLWSWTPVFFLSVITVYPLLNHEQQTVFCWTEVVDLLVLRQGPQAMGSLWKDTLLACFVTLFLDKHTFYYHCIIHSFSHSCIHSFIYIHIYTLYIFLYTYTDNESYPYDCKHGFRVSSKIDGSPTVHFQPRCEVLDWQILGWGDPVHSTWCDSS